jgi:hypothetical protein
VGRSAPTLTFEKTPMVARNQHVLMTMIIGLTITEKKTDAKRNPIGFRLYNETSKRISYMMRNLKIVSCIIRNLEKV